MCALCCLGNNGCGLSRVGWIAEEDGIKGLGGALTLRDMRGGGVWEDFGERLGWSESKEGTSVRG